MAGRGGAGNIIALQQQNERIAEDIESNLAPERQVPASPLGQQRQRASSYASAPHDASEIASMTKEQNQYAYTGRGGAGNYYSPSELDKKGHFVDAHRSQILGDGTLAPGGKGNYTVAPPSRWQGRGGAGNYLYGVAEGEERATRKRLEHERMKEEGLKAAVEKRVEERLPMPPKAKLYGSGNDVV